jgi:D-alanyl-D-alanine carboxypeptidase
MRRAGAAALLVLAQPAAAQLCDGRAAPQAADGRVLGHLPYGEAAAYDLVDAPPGFGLRACKVRREMLPDLQRLLAAAASDPTVGGMIYGLSCHRTLEQQQAVFCKGGGSDPANRAISAAPPGHSEHSSGLAIDFAIRPRPANGCPDAEACMAALPAAKWLRDNATRFGFEQSFPAANRQGVKWEPWHWRWVGRSALVPGVARARFVFARARREFPAGPGIVDPPPVVRTIPDAPPPAPPVESGKRKKRRR